MLNVQLNEKPEESFPKLVKSAKGAIILLYSADMTARHGNGNGSGICLDAGDTFTSAGVYSTTWDMEQMTPYRGTITLEND